MASNIMNNLLLVFLTIYITLSLIGLVVFISEMRNCSEDEDTSTNIA